MATHFPLKIDFTPIKPIAGPYENIGMNSSQATKIG